MDHFKLRYSPAVAALPPSLAVLTLIMENNYRVLNISVEGKCSAPDYLELEPFLIESISDSGLDNVTALDSSTNHTNLPPCSYGQLLPPTTGGVRSPDHTVPTTDPTLSHTNHSTTGLSIRLLKPRLNPGGGVILQGIETHVHLDIVFPSQSWNAIQLPHTESVTSDDSSSIGEDIKPLLLAITVRGATTRQECDLVCNQCEQRVGQRMGGRSLIDFHSPSNIITPRGGKVQVHFTFRCYSRHHRKEDKQYTYVAVEPLMIS